MIISKSTSEMRYTTSVMLLLLLHSLCLLSTITGAFQLNLPFSNTKHHHHNENAKQSSPSLLQSSTPTPTPTSTPNDQIKNDKESIFTATNTLLQFDQRQQAYMQRNPIGMGGGTSALQFVRTQLSKEDRDDIRNAVTILVNKANEEREAIEYARKRNLPPPSFTTTNDDTTTNTTTTTTAAATSGGGGGRVMLGICAQNVPEALMGLKTWIPTLSLPKGLLHGMDVDGRPIPPEDLGSVYVKYNTGGTMTFGEMRRSGLGFDGLWRPGDAVLEMYDGDFRGVYLNVELGDGVFRQFGVLPTDLFLEEEDDDW